MMSLFNSSDRGEERIAFPAQLHTSNSDACDDNHHDDIISARQAISINTHSDEDTLATLESSFDAHHDSNSKTEGGGIESHSDCSQANEYSIISTAHETIDGSGTDSPYNPTDIDDGYASDDSCASHDSFVANIWATIFHPPASSYQLGYSPFVKKKAKDCPALDTMRGVTKTVSYSRLEMLAPELRIQILRSMPDLETLHSFVSACPTMHTQYLYDRHNILCACLGRELEGLCVDAYVHLKSRVSELGMSRDNDKIIDFLGCYRSWSTSPDSCPDLKSLPPSRVRWMAAYHTSVALPLLRRYASWALGNFEKVAIALATRNGTTHVGHRIELSRSEEIRVLRALYRHETYNHLFGINMGHREGDFFMNEIQDLFFTIFEPWECEAIACVDTFARGQYDGIFDKIRDGLHPNNPRFSQYPAGSFDLSRERIMQREAYMDGTLSRGLKTLVRALEIEDQEQLVSWMGDCLMTPLDTDCILSESISMSAHLDRRARFANSPNDKDMAEQRADSMEFLGDSLPLDGPPLAWVVLWDGIYVNLYGEFTPNSLKRWGYVMWDASRWDGMRVDELIALLWNSKPSMLEVIERACGWNPPSIEVGDGTDSIDGDIWADTLSDM
ncbi:hypothetical protein F4803DRAFT_572328 [Xylaria telfairii]|nr:hypothetical protein F4803DRAFT_572328 [Xylaria telfairii]